MSIFYSRASKFPRPLQAARSHSSALGHREPIDKTSERALANQHVVLTTPRQEILWLLIILAAGMLPRLAFVHAFPAQPISDFLSLLNFSVAFRADWIARSAPQWRLLSPGLPFFLSLLLRIIPRSPETVARLATAALTGLVPLLPYVLWRGAFRLRTRIIAALLLALWPGQIVFSSVLAQDNWVILPTIALVVLAVRLVVIRSGGNPILAVVLYVSAVAIREEMLLILLPVVILVAIGTRPDNWLRSVIVGSLTAVVLLGALITQRGIATGRYTLFTAHLGASVLGAYVPGAGMVWVIPAPFVDARQPGLLESNISDKDLNRAEIDLAWHEFLRRPEYHMLRIVGTTLLSFLEMDKSVTSWSLTSPGVMPQELRKNAMAFRNGLIPVLGAYPFLLQTLFAACLYFAIGHRSLWMRLTPLLIPMVLKIGLHILVVSQARYFLVVVALEMLVIAIVSDKVFEVSPPTVLIRPLLLGIVTVASLFLLAVVARGYVLQNLEAPPAQARVSPSTSSSLAIGHVQTADMGKPATFAVIRFPRVASLLQPFRLDRGVVPCENSKTEC